MQTDAVLAMPAQEAAAAPAVSVVIPVLNEGEHINATLDALSRHLPVPHEVLIVYDRDEDTTLPVVRERLRYDARLALVKNTVARGPSGALRSGFAAARAPKVLVVMADGCDDLSQVSVMLSLVPERADIVCPSRYCRGGAQLLDQTWWLKAWIPRAAGFLLRGLAGIRTSDPTNSFKLYSGRLLRSLRLVSTVSFSVTLEAVVKAHCLGYRIAELPTVWRDRTQGQSHFKLGRSILVYFPWFCLALLRGRFIRLPRRWFAAWFAAPAAAEAPQAVSHA